MDATPPALWADSDYTLVLSVEDKAGTHQPFCIADGDGGRANRRMFVNWSMTAVFPDAII